MPPLINTLTSTSIFIPFFKKLYISYCYIELWLDNLFKNSHIGNTIQKFWQAIKINFRYSFLGKITYYMEIEDYSRVLPNSKFVKSLLQIPGIWKNKIRFYLERSTTVASIKETKKELPLLPIKIGSIIIITGILTNTLFSILFNKEMGLPNWIIRILFLIIGLGGIFCNANWRNIKNTSFILRLFIGQV